MDGLLHDVALSATLDIWCYTSCWIKTLSLCMQTLISESRTTTLWCVLCILIHALKVTERSHCGISDDAQVPLFSSLKSTTQHSWIIFILDFTSHSIDFQPVQRQELEATQHCKETTLPFSARTPYKDIRRRKHPALLYTSCVAQLSGVWWSREAERRIASQGDFCDISAEESISRVPRTDMSNQYSSVSTRFQPQRMRSRP